MVKRINDWKHKLLSGAGREVLIKSVLQAIPTYAMSCFKLPAVLCKELTRNIMRFWWSSGKNKGIHWVRAEEVYKDKDNGGLGFRKLELMNIALLAKQGWRFISSPQLLVSKVYKAKYFPSLDIFNASSGAHPSYAWRSIYDAMEVLKRGTEWDKESGAYRWILDGSGSLTAKSANVATANIEKWRRGDRSEQSNPGESRRFWKAFWKLRVPNKVKIFEWRLFHDGLPTLQNLARRACEVNNSCSLCGAKGEHALHLFRDCWWTKELLREHALPLPVWSNQCQEPGYWLWLYAKLCKEKEFCTLLLALWLVWKNRNEIIHGKEGRRMADLKLRLRWLEREAKNGREDLIWWQERPDNRRGEAVVMCDGSFDEKSRTAGAGVVLIVEGKVQEVRARWFDKASAVLQAECRAVFMGLQLASELNLRKVRLFTDSREVLWAINAGSWNPEAYMEVLKDCISLLNAHKDWVLGGVDRDVNVQADCLARKARSERWEWLVSTAIPAGLPGL